MLILAGQNKTESSQNMTVDGIYINAYLVAAATNTAITASTAFLSINAQIKAELKRKGSNMNIMSDNLQVLGHYSAKDYDHAAWYRGRILTAAAVGVYETMMVQCFIPFGGCINLKGDDELVIQAISSTGVFSAALNSANSYLEFNLRSAIGYEIGTPQIVSQVVQANISQQRFYLGENVTKIMFLNLDKTDISAASQVITTASINSDKLDQTFNFYDLLNQNANVLNPNRYNPTYITAAGAEALYTTPKYPQMLTLFASPATQNSSLDNCNVQFTFNTTNVNASNNFVVCTRFYFTPEKVIETATMIAKHQEENKEKILS